MTSKLISAIRTRSEADELISEIELLKNSLYEDGEKSYRSTLENNVRYWVVSIINEETLDKTKDIEKYLETLLEDISHLKEIKLTLAFEPRNSGINMFLEYLRENVDKDLILEIDHDPKILGGTIISYKGNYHDYSLVRVFNDEFEENRDHIMRILQYEMNE